MDNKIDFDDIYIQYYAQKPKGLTEFQAIKTLSSSLGIGSLYEFLEVERGEINTISLYQKAIQKKRRTIKEKPEGSIEILKLCETCFSVFETQEKQEEYDDSLDYESRKAILDSAARTAKSQGGKLSEPQFAEYTRLLIDPVKNRRLAAEILTAFCEVKNIDYSGNYSSEDAIKKPNEVTLDIKSAVQPETLQQIETMPKEAFLGNGIDGHSNVAENNNDADAYNDIYYKYYVQEPKGTAELTHVSQAIDAMGIDSLYQFLGVEQHSLDYAGLYLKAEDKKRNLRKDNPENSTAIELCEMCLDVFRSVESHKTYDGLLFYEKRKTILDNAEKTAMSQGRQLTDAQRTEFIFALVSLFKDNRLGTEVFNAFCKVKQIFSGGITLVEAKKAVESKLREAEAWITHVQEVLKIYTESQTYLKTFPWGELSRESNEMIISLMEKLKVEEDEVSQISAKIKMQAQKLEEAENVSKITDVKEEIVKAIEHISYVSETINNIAEPLRAVIRKKSAELQNCLIIKYEFDYGFKEEKNEIIMPLEILGLNNNGTITVDGNQEKKENDIDVVSHWDGITFISTTHTRFSYCTIIGLKVDGTIIVAGYSSEYIQNKTKHWQNIRSISVCDNHIVGLKKDCTVVANSTRDDKYSDTKNNECGECDVDDWRDIVSISANSSFSRIDDKYHYLAFTIGLKKDGTVISTGNNHYGQCNVQDWREIVAIYTSSKHTVGLKENGTVIAVGSNEYGQCNVEDWQGIVAIYLTEYATVGLKADGTVIAVGDNRYDYCNVSDWQGIIAISINEQSIVGLKADGKVVMSNYTFGFVNGPMQYFQSNISDWREIIAISSVGYLTIGLKVDGTIVVCGVQSVSVNNDSICNLTGFDSSPLKVKDWHKIGPMSEAQKEKCKQEQLKKAAESKLMEAEAWITNVLEY